jgi:hypothetical protein
MPPKSIKPNDDVARHFREILAPIQQYQRLTAHTQVATVEDQSDIALGMIVNQGVIGIKYWTGVDVDAPVMRRTLENIFST